MRRVYNKLLSDRLYFAVFASGKPREEVRCSRVTLLRSSHCFSGRALPFPVPLPAQGRASLENPDAEASPLIFLWLIYALFYRSEEPVDIHYADRKTSLKLNVNEFGQVSIVE